MGEDTKREVYGLTIVRAPGGGLVLIGGPLDLSRAESLSPRWEREVKATRPKRIARPPNPENGRIAYDIVPVLTKVGVELVHGEGVSQLLRRLNRESGKLLNVAMLEPEQPLEVLEALQRHTKPVHKGKKETSKDKNVRAERALGFVGKTDDFVRAALTKLGRKPEDVERYIRGRRAA